MCCAKQGGSVGQLSLQNTSMKRMILLILLPVKKQLRYSKVSLPPSCGQDNQHKRRRLNDSTLVPAFDFDPATFEYLYIQWLSRCSVAFRMVEVSEFGTLLLYLNPQINNWLPESHATIQGWTIRTYESRRSGS